MREEAAEDVPRSRRCIERCTQLLAIAALTVGCGDLPAPEVSPRYRHAGGRDFAGCEHRGVLDAVNGAASVADLEARGLGASAAAVLLAYRSGADGVRGTDDDLAFETKGASTSSSSAESSAAPSTNSRRSPWFPGSTARRAPARS